MKLSMVCGLIVAVGSVWGMDQRLVRDQMKSIEDEMDNLTRQIDDQIQQTNERLQQTNERLQQTNERLQQTNDQIQQRDNQIHQADGQIHQADGQIQQRVDRIQQSDERLQQSEREIKLWTWIQRGVIGLGALMLVGLVGITYYPWNQQKNLFDPLAKYKNIFGNSFRLLSNNGVFPSKVTSQLSDLYSKRKTRYKMKPLGE